MPPLLLDSCQDGEDGAEPVYKSTRRKIINSGMRRF